MTKLRHDTVMTCLRDVKLLVHLHNNQLNKNLENHLMIEFFSSCIFHVMLGEYQVMITTSRYQFLIGRVPVHSWYARFFL